MATEQSQLSVGPPKRMSRAIQLVFAGVIAIAFVGFVVGIRQGKTAPEFQPPPREQVAEYPDAIRATAWRDFDRRKFGPNRDWHNSLVSLKLPPMESMVTGPASDEDRRALHFIRSNRRAHPGAPPVVPHPIDQMSTASCTVCHGEGLWIGKGIRAPKMSHGLLTNCTQCHAESQSADLAPVLVAENVFQRIEPPLKGQRAWQGAPPTIPHPTWMRENCSSCHGPTGPVSIRTTHPLRASCLQCHVSSAVSDQMVAEDQPQWISGAETASVRSGKP